MQCGTESTTNKAADTKSTAQSTASKTGTQIQFEAITSAQSNVTFQNTINELDPNFNFFVYNQIYMGSGVAAHDFDNDGLIDIFFQSSRGIPQLYKNQGDFKFEEKPLSANLFNTKAVGTGVSVVDINQDGLLDVYLSYTGPTKLPPGSKRNHLLINKGDFRFEEKASEYGIADAGNGVQGVWFDYDRDGDLDLYQVNTNSDLRVVNAVVNKKELASRLDFVDQYGAQDHLYRNDGTGKMTEVTYAAGIIPEIFNGFNASIGDYNQDMYPDIFVTNDFAGPDLLYINNQDGTFSEKGEEYFKHTSFFSMGSDVSDLNNDWYDDLVVLDMAPEDYVRSRRTMSMSDPKYFEAMVDEGYNNQYMHNMLHLNTGFDGFSEISQFAGIEKTDWSWSVLSEDFNLDGNKDIFVTNGIYRDIIDKDLTDRMQKAFEGVSTPAQMRVVMEDVYQIMPSQPLSNYLFQSNGDNTFENIASEAGMSKATYSNGAAIADFDQDGKLDIVINNMLQEALIYRNVSNVEANHTTIKLSGSPKNPKGIGSKICVTIDDGTQCNSVLLQRGVMSSMEAAEQFHTGQSEMIDEVKVLWADGRISIINNVNVEEELVIAYADSQAGQKFYPDRSNSLVSEAKGHRLQTFVHKENKYDDLQEQILLPHKLSTLGPAFASADINGDGLEEVFVGGANGQKSKFFLSKNGQYSSDLPIGDANLEDSAAHFADINGDGVKDLVVVSGSYEYLDGSAYQSMRVNFLRENGTIKAFKAVNLKSNVASIATTDIDQNGQLEILLGGRVIANRYPLTPQSYIYTFNNGDLEEVTDKISPEFRSLGMITSMTVANIDQDPEDEIIVVGEWMPITILNQNNGKIEITRLEDTEGWWNVVTSADIDGDGDQDLLCGNLGLNYKFEASKEKPFHCYSDDFDANGTYDIVLAKHSDDRFLPIRGKVCSSEQMPFIEERFSTFNEYANADLADIYGDHRLERAHHLVVKEFQHMLLDNDGKGNFSSTPLIKESQRSPIYDFITTDINQDGKLDIIAAGNQYGSEVETTRADSGTGVVLINKGNLEFSNMKATESGFLADLQARNLELLSDGHLVVANNNGPIQVFKVIK